MRVARLHAARDLRIHNEPVPVPGLSEVLLRVKAVGVCGSDTHYYTEGHTGDTWITEPHVLGHEFSAQVEQVGTEVTNVKPGDPVAVEPGWSCGYCDWCEQGHPNLCPNVRFCGTPPTDGALREFMTWPAHLVFPVPPRVSFAEAAAFEPLAIGIHCVNFLGSIKPGDTVAVLGSGPIGLTVVMIAKAAGATQIIATDLIDKRLLVAQQVGATDIVNAQQNDQVAAIKELTRGRGVDVVFEAAGAVETPHQAVQVARIGGLVVIIGIFREEMIAIGSSTARRKGLTIKFDRRTKHAMNRAIELTQQGVVDLKPMLTHRFPLERAAEALELVERKADGVIKAVIEL